MTDRILSVHDAYALGRIIEACWRSQKVARLMDGSGDIIEGTARSIGDQRSNFIGAGEDVRDAYLRVTTTHGWEVFWPITDLIRDFQTAIFIIES
jgi:hypothetical protein